MKYLPAKKPEENGAAGKNFSISIYILYSRIDWHKWYGTTC